MTRGRWLVVASLSLVAVVIAMIAIGLAGAPTPHGDPQLRLSQLREGDVVFLDEHDLFVVWNDGEPLALSNHAQHLDGDIVRYCPSSGLFESPMHGEKFDDRGFYYAGPAARGLDRYPVLVNGGLVTIDLDHPETGPERGEGPAEEPQGSFCVGGVGWGDRAGFFDD